MMLKIDESRKMADLKQYKAQETDKSNVTSNLKFEGAGPDSTDRNNFGKAKDLFEKRMNQSLLWQKQTIKKVGKMSSFKLTNRCSTRNGIVRIQKDEKLNSDLIDIVDKDDFKSSKEADTLTDKATNTQSPRMEISLEPTAYSKQEEPFDHSKTLQDFDASQIKEVKLIDQLFESMPKKEPKPVRNRRLVISFDKSQNMRVVNKIKEMQTIYKGEKRFDMSPSNQTSAFGVRPSRYGSNLSVSYSDVKQRLNANFYNGSRMQSTDSTNLNP